MALSDEEIEHRKAFGRALARARKTRGWSQTQFRDQLLTRGATVSVGGVGMWETGKNAPTPPQIRAIETTLGKPGLGLILGIDTGALARLTDEVAELRDRVAAIEGATSPAAAHEADVHPLPMAAESGTVPDEPIDYRPGRRSVRSVDPDHDD